MFAIGDRVTISLAGTRWCVIRGGDFSPHGSNPFGIEGVVVQDRGPDNGLRFRVKWSNGSTNSYAEWDLEAVRAIIVENE